MSVSIIVSFTKLISNVHHVETH